MVSAKKLWLTIIIFLGLMGLLWYLVFAITEATWWGSNIKPLRQIKPPQPPKIELIGIQSIDLTEILNQLADQPPAQH